MNDLSRFLALERRLLERLSTRTQPFERGVAYLDEDYPQRYSSNLLVVDGRLTGVPPRALLNAADAVLGGAGYGHRAVLIRDEREGERSAPAFVAAGYTVERNALMIHRRPPDRGPAISAREAAFAEASPLIREVYRREPWADSDEIVDRFTEQHGKYERSIGARFFVVRIGDDLAGYAELYVDGEDAQVENVATLEEFRGRGVARAVVLGALDAARDAGARHVFIVADDDDWPKELYMRFGFDRIGRTWQFIRAPS